MKIVHITDMHFGSYQWNANNDALLDRINKFNPDIVFNTGDSTTDSLEDEFKQAQDFLTKINCKNVISIMGNHDKFSRRSCDFFRKYIYNTKFIEPKDKTKVRKPEVYQNPITVKLDNYLYESNFVEQLELDGEKILVVGLDTCLLRNDNGDTEKEILNSISDIINSTPHDRVFMLTHHSILITDSDPLARSKIIKDFMIQHKIEANFCGHTHELDIMEVKDIVRGGGFRQFMCGSMSSLTAITEPNMYCTYENLGEEDEKITVIKMFCDGKNINFEEMVISS